MSQPPYEFFPGAPVAPDRPEDAAAGYGWQAGLPTQARPAAGASGEVSGRRPGVATLLAGLLVAEAALLGGPGVALLLLRDVLGAVLAGISSFASDTAGLGAAAATEPSASSVTGRITLWAVLLLAATLGAAVAATGVLDGRQWGWGIAMAVQAAGVFWAVTHVGTWAAVGGTAMVLSVAVAALLAVPDVRRWCGAGT